MVLTWLMKGAFYKSFLLYIKMSEGADLTYYQRNRDMTLNRGKDYYENDKKRLREQARDKYSNLSEEQHIRRTDIVICLKKRNKG